MGHASGGVITDVAIGGAVLGFNIIFDALFIDVIPGDFCDVGIGVDELEGSACPITQTEGLKIEGGEGHPRRIGDGGVWAWRLPLSS